jgi:hypothetical protein
MQPRTLADFKGEVTPSGDQLNFRDCPVCGSDGKKVYLDPKTGAWFCFAGGHHAGGKVDVGLDDTSAGQDLLDMLIVVHQSVVWSETELPPWEPLSKTAKNYLARRGIGQYEASKLGLVEWTGQGRILVPYFSEGELIYWTGRRYSTVYGEGPKYLSMPGKKPLYTPVHLDDHDVDTLVLVEGTFDAIRVEQAGYAAVALGGKSLPQYLREKLLTLARDRDIIIVMLDEDALGSAVQIQDTLMARTRATVRILPIDGDPGDMPKHEIRRMI